MRAFHGRGLRAQPGVGDIVSRGRDFVKAKVEGPGERRGLAPLSSKTAGTRPAARLSGGRPTIAVDWIWFERQQPMGPRDGKVNMTGHDEEVFAEGCEAAKVDIAAGRLTYRWGGHAGHWGHWIVVKLKERFDVGVNDGFGVCMVTIESLSFDAGYNGVLIAEIDRRHGQGAFQSLMGESRRQSEESLWEAKELWIKAKGPHLSNGQRPF
jgi:hypothetical protein